MLAVRLGLYEAATHGAPGDSTERETVSPVRPAADGQGSWGLLALRR